MIQKYFLASLFVYINCTHAVNIAITIDDYPLPNSALFSTKERTERFIKACTEQGNNCKVAFFCIGQNCTEQNNADYLKLLETNGHFIANHSMTHATLSKLSLHEFEQEITTTDAILNAYSTMKKWYRYPCLDFGKTREDYHDSLECLQQLGYREGFVSINTFDWYINKKLQEATAQHKTIPYDTLRTVYLTLLAEWIERAIDHYQKTLPTEITHTLLLHDNDLNALYLGDIITMIHDKGWHIVSPEVAFQHVAWRRDLQNLDWKPDSLSIAYINKKLETAQIH
jgi:peptidoglycan/xylan/chitin deacetylase (PgdA/CDA1 family)